MATASTSSWSIVAGPSFQKKNKASAIKRSDDLVSVKWSARPGLLHCPKRHDAEWLLEFAAESPTLSSEGRAAETSHAFSGAQTAAKDVDCLLIWDDDRQAYVLEKISSCFSLRYERKPTKLSKEAEHVLSSRPDDVLMRDVRKVEEELDEQEEGELGSDEFAEQLQRDLDARSGHTSPTAERDIDREREMSRTNSNTGLGLINAGGLHEEIITPRGSPYADRTAKVFAASKTNDLTHSAHMRSTPGMSPVSVANSPRPTGLESSLSSTWRPPAQRSNVALRFDEDEDDDDEDEESEEEEEDEEGEEEEDDDDLDAFARELEGSLMEPSSAVEEKLEAPATLARTRRASNRSRKT